MFRQILHIWTSILVLRAIVRAPRKFHRKIQGLHKQLCLYRSGRSCQRQSFSITSFKTCQLNPAVIAQTHSLLEVILHSMASFLGRSVTPSPPYLCWHILVKIRRLYINGVICSSRILNRNNILKIIPIYWEIYCMVLAINLRIYLTLTHINITTYTIIITIII